jgi:hypothetical protein
MKLLITTTLIFVLLTDLNAQSCKRLLTTTYADSVDVIMTGEYTDLYKGDFYMFGTKDVYQGDPPYTVLIDTASTRIRFEDGHLYLLYAKRISNEGQKFRIDSCSRSALVSEAADDIRFLEQKIVCPGKPYFRNPCTKQSYLVCGCDGKVYNTPCDARRAGITRYRFGTCKR